MKRKMQGAMQFGLNFRIKQPKSQLMITVQKL